MDKAIIRIMCDSTKNRILYQWYDHLIDEFVDISSDFSALVREEFAYEGLCYRVYNILSIISKEFLPREFGLQIVFCGSEDDYAIFCEAIRSFYSEMNIECTRDEEISEFLRKMAIMCDSWQKKLKAIAGSKITAVEAIKDILI